jgi:endonuclease/exonuclease/phosphatase family metal-dependent hydrolase
MNFGASKSEMELKYIAFTIKDFDLICLTEVVAGKGGLEAVEDLHSLLLNDSPNWSFVVSEPTSSLKSGEERYAYLWKKDKLKLIGVPELTKFFSKEIEREPYIATFSYQDKTFTVIPIHAIPKSKQPETELKYLKYFDELYKNKNLLFAGDYNCPQYHTVFLPLKKLGYKPILTDQKTTLRQKCIDDDCLASEFDNMFYNPSKIILLKSEAIHFYKKINNLKVARTISDHLPIYMDFLVK